MHHSNMINVLLIEDNKKGTNSVKGILLTGKEKTFSVTHSIDFFKFAQLENIAHYQVLLLHVQLSDGDVLSCLHQIHELYPVLPIIVIGNDDNAQFALNVMQAGAQDFLIRQEVNYHLLVRSISYGMERLQTQERLNYLAHYDVLTNLPNRVLFKDRLDRALAHLENSTKCVGLMFLDLDHFKSVNDTLGHDAGDQLLVAVANRFKLCMRRGDTLARLGGDEFTIILEELISEEDAEQVAKKIISMMSRSFVIEGHEVFITTSIGIAMCQDLETGTKDLIKYADAALYNAKDQGRSNYQFFNSEMQRVSSQRLGLVTSLRYAMERNEFVLHYQPQFDTKTHQVIGVEALIRWKHPDLGLIPPQKFIHVLEDTGLILPVGEWVLRTACNQNLAWQEAGLPPITIAVNLSPRQFRQKNLVSMISSLLVEVGMDAKYLQLEITEGLLVDNVNIVAAILRALNTIGVKTSLDDFGTGYSSLIYLKQFPLDALKLDRAFLQDIDDDKDDAAIVNAIITLGHSLGLKVIAEGVETEQQYEYLCRRDCDVVQGNLLSGALSSQQFYEWYLNNCSYNKKIDNNLVEA